MARSADLKNVIQSEKSGKAMLSTKKEKKNSPFSELTQSF